MLKSTIVKLLRHRWLGVPAAVAAHVLGAKTISRKISLGCNFVPPRVWVAVPERFANGRGFTMYGVGAHDQVARIMWWLGWEGYEKPMPDLFAALSRDARCVMDIGAYSGFFSLIAATCEPRAQVYAFEPFGPPRGWLERNVAVNKLEDRLHVLSLAVSDQAGEADFFVPTTDTGLMETASSLNAQHRSSHLESFKVKVTTLDEFTAEHGCGPVDLMKIDVETVEDRVLRGAERVIQESRPIIFLEVLPSADPEPLRSVRDEYGYVSGILLATGVEWQNQIVASWDHYDHVFCPVEKKDWFEQKVSSLGYATTPANVG